MKDATPPSAGIQSLDAALGLLGTLAMQPGPSTLSDIANLAGMPASRAHRYLASFIQAGLVTRAGTRYDLGPGALRLGLAAMARHDFVSRTADGLDQLTEDTGLTALLCVWGERGATVVRWARAASPLAASLALGSTLPLLNSATGRVFLAWAPRALVAEALRRELARARRQPHLLPDVAPNQAAVRDLAADVRRDGHAAVDSTFIPGLAAISAPVLDWQGEVQVAVTLIGTHRDSVARDSSAARALLAFTQVHSVIHTD